MFYARNGGAAAVPPYAADATNKQQWEQGQRRHQRAMDQLTKSMPNIDQKEPEARVNASLHRGRERSKAFLEHVRHQHVGQENRKLMGALNDIAKKPCITLKRIEKETWKLPDLSCATNKAADRRRKQSSLMAENEKLVKRLLAIRTTFDRRGDDKEYKRHQRAVQDMAKVPPPSSMPWQREKKKRPVHLPQLPEAPGEAAGRGALGRPFASKSAPSLEFPGGDDGGTSSPSAPGPPPADDDQDAESEQGTFLRAEALPRGVGRGASPLSGSSSPKRASSSRGFLAISGGDAERRAESAGLADGPGAWQVRSQPRSPAEVHSPGSDVGERPGTSGEACSEVAAEVGANILAESRSEFRASRRSRGSTSPARFTDKSWRSVRTVRTSNDDISDDSGFDIAVVGAQTLSAAGLNPTDFFPSWHPSTGDNEVAHEALCYDLP